MPTLLLNESSRVYLNNVLNEVLHGLQVNYEADLGAVRGDVLRISGELRAGRPGKSGLERLTATEVKLLLACSDLCLRELGEAEFETRLGEAPDLARRVNQSLVAELERFPVPA